MVQSYIWQYRFGQLESSSDDGKMRLQLVFKNGRDRTLLETRVRQLETWFRWLIVDKF